MTDEERKLALYCLKASSDYHSEVCEECIKYPNCGHTGQDDVTETIIQALEQEPKKGHWIVEEWSKREHHTCSVCQIVVNYEPCYHYCPYCGAEMEVENENR
jgi:hypothetical protein